jgi:uncharacterized protein (DUF952 family)
MIYHITTPEQWAIWENYTIYEPMQFGAEGFIHLCTEAQMDGVLSRYYSGISPLWILHVDESALTEPLRWELSTGGELFPHLYGSLNKSAVVEVVVV